jgi:hypothetical protein
MTLPSGSLHRLYLRDEEGEATALPYSSSSEESEDESSKEGTGEEQKNLWHQHIFPKGSPFSIVAA